MKRETKDQLQTTLHQMMCFHYTFTCHITMQDRSIILAHRNAFQLSNRKYIRWVMQLGMPAKAMNYQCSGLLDIFSLTNCLFKQETIVTCHITIQDRRIKFHRIGTHYNFEANRKYIR